MADTTPPTILLDHYNDPYHRGPCERPSCGATQYFGECGLQIELVVSPEQCVDEAWFDGQGCTICEGIASLLVEFVEGKSVDKVRSITTSAVLQGHGLDEALLGACASLPVRTLRASLKSLGATPDDGEDTTQFGGPSLREEC